MDTMLQSALIVEHRGWESALLHVNMRLQNRYLPVRDADLISSNRMYATCQVDEDLPYLLKVAGEDSLMIGSDYTHRDSSMEYEFPRLLKERADKGEITQTAVQKILYDNAKRIYGL